MFIFIKATFIIARNGKQHRCPSGMAHDSQSELAKVDLSLHLHHVLEGPHGSQLLCSEKSGPHRQAMSRLLSRGLAPATGVGVGKATL